MLQLLLLSSLGSRRSPSLDFVDPSAAENSEMNAFCGKEFWNHHLVTRSVSVLGPSQLFFPWTHAFCQLPLFSWTWIISSKSQNLSSE